MPACVRPRERASPPEGERMLARSRTARAAEGRAGAAPAAPSTPQEGRGPTACRTRSATGSSPPSRPTATARPPSRWRCSSAGSGRMPGRVALPFPIDRRALAGHRELGLTEARVRGAHPGPGGGRVPGPLRHLRLALQGDRGGPAPQAGPVPVRVGLCAACSSRPTGGLRRPVAGRRALAAP